jgi:two-component system, OmpR family, response regulator QseB
LRVRLLLVENETNIARPILLALRALGHEVRHASDLTTARAMLLDSEPDLMLLDVRLPESEDGGFILAREARASGYKGLILFLTARDTSQDRVLGLDDGGDDYVVKPFDLPELMARVRALLRRVSDIKTNRIRAGALELDWAQRTVLWQNSLVELSTREFALLERFVRTPGRVFSSEELTDAIWGVDANSVGVVKVYVHYLRTKIDSSVIRTVAGGYRFGLELS